MSRNLRQKNVTIWASRRARALKKRHHMGISQSSCPKSRRDGMSRLASSRNVQWSTEGATNCVYPRVQTQVDLYSLRSGNCDERKMKEYIYFLRKMKYVCSAKNEGVILDDGNFDSRRTSQHPCLTLWGRMVFVSTFSSEKTQLQMRKKWEYFQICFSSFYLPKKTRAKKFRRHF